VKSRVKDTEGKSKEDEAGNWICFLRLEFMVLQVIGGVEKKPGPPVE
jgi:hypothetical protein